MEKFKFLWLVRHIGAGSTGEAGKNTPVRTAA